MNKLPKEVVETGILTALKDTWTGTWIGDKKKDKSQMQAKLKWGVLIGMDMLAE